MDNLVLDKSKAFAICTVRLCRYMCEKKHEYVLSKQLLRSGTSIGANCREACRAQSKADFLSKLQIALKEADESAYWLELLYRTGYLSESEFKTLDSACTSIRVMLISSVKTAKDNQS